MSTPEGHFEPDPPSGQRRVAIRNLARACVLIIAIVGLIYAAVHWPRSRPANQSLNPLTSRGREAPSFVLPTVDGKVVHLSDYRGKSVLLNFFGNTCVPCRQESPWLVDIQKRNAARGLQIIGIEMYGASNDAINAYTKEFGTNYVIVHGSDAIGDEYGIGQLPVTYFLDAKGTIIAGTVGLHSEKEIEANMEAALQHD